MIAIILAIVTALTVLGKLIIMSSKTSIARAKEDWHSFQSTVTPAINTTTATRTKKI